MEKWCNLIKKLKFLILLNIFFLVFKNNALSQVFDVPDYLIESPLIYSHETNLKGISRITPVKDSFSKYTVLELSLVKTNINYPSKWLKDKFFDELGNIAETERLIRSKDSPLSDPVFEQFKHLPFYIDDTLEQLALNPLVFCNKINMLYNATGKFYELNCTIPFGFFNKYLIMRLQYKENLWYFTKIMTLNYNRLIELISVAESFKIIKNVN
jgi:hypothetical protein